MAFVLISEWSARTAGDRLLVVPFSITSLLQLYLWISTLLSRKQNMSFIINLNEILASSQTSMVRDFLKHLRLRIYPTQLFHEGKVSVGIVLACVLKW